MVRDDYADITVREHRQGINRKNSLNLGSSVGQLVNARLEIEALSDVDKTVAVAIGQVYSAVLAGNVTLHLEGFGTAFPLDPQQVEVASGRIRQWRTTFFPRKQITCRCARSGRVDA